MKEERRLLQWIDISPNITTQSGSVIPSNLRATLAYICNKNEPSLHVGASKAGSTCIR
jgi:hypothetical protein